MKIGVFSYFGVQKPELLTRGDELNPDGVPAIDETRLPEDDLLWSYIPLNRNKKAPYNGAFLMHKQY